MKTKIFFDLDGTVYDLYNIDNWLEKVRGARAEVFSEGTPMVNLKELEKICSKLVSKGFEFGVITWLPMQASREFESECTAIKQEWVKRHMPYVTSFAAQSYGIPKQKAIDKRYGRLILVDDNDEVLKMWKTKKQRMTIDAKKNILEELDRLL